MTHARSPKATHLLIVAALLLLQFLIRTYNTTVQDPYLDEGFHIVRADRIYDFEQHPGRFAHGKVLLYFWLGVFQPTPDTGLHVSRSGMALFSLITTSAIYAIGRRIANHRTGALALALYAVLPLAFFYERMAMADPLAAGLAALVAWRSLSFARRPTLRAGIVLGGLLAMASLAKLTMGLLPLLPGMMGLIYYPWQRRESLRPQLWRWIETYFPPLLVAACVVALVWLPFLIPAYLARNSDDPFILVDSFNVRTSADDPQSPLSYIRETLPLMIQATSRGLLIAAGLALAYLLLASVRDRRLAQGVLLVLAWLLALLGLSLVAARLSTLRYVSPAAGPLCMILALAASRLWDAPRFRPIARRAVVAAAAAWLWLFAWPFIQTDLTAPEDLPFSGTNYTEYQSGYLSADDAVRAAAVTLNQAEPPAARTYANWWLCHLLYFYVDQQPVCLGYSTASADLQAGVAADLEPGEIAYLALTGYQPFFQSIDGLCWEPVAQHDRANISREVWDVWVWRIWTGPTCARAGS
ncbi:MAG: hypothetical protein GXY36_13055 [Chloroflexi bacterium]|nr:hypothetical protein [Chloroflexota bacterium]